MYTFTCLNLSICPCVLQWWHMDASGGVAGDGGVCVHFLWAHPQLIDGCRVRPCCWGEWDIWVIICIRVCGLRGDGRRHCWSLSLGITCSRVLFAEPWGIRLEQIPAWAKCIAGWFEEFNLYVNFFKCACVNCNARLCLCASVGGM